MPSIDPYETATPTPARRTSSDATLTVPSVSHQHKLPRLPLYFRPVSQELTRAFREVTAFALSGRRAESRCSEQYLRRAGPVLSDTNVG
jgi:hypothetical protein